MPQLGLGQETVMDEAGTGHFPLNNTKIRLSYCNSSITWTGVTKEVGYFKKLGATGAEL